MNLFLLIDVIFLHFLQFLINIPNIPNILNYLYISNFKIHYIIINTMKLFNLY